MNTASPAVAKLRAIERRKIRFLSMWSRCWKIWAQIDLTEIHWVIVGGESGSQFHSEPYESVECGRGLYA